MKLSTLNREQKSAVTTTEGRIRVVAGAGSGKTRTLVYRYAYLMNEMGIPQSNILCLTFTNKAAQEMRSRIAGLVPGGATGDFVSTIHGFCVKFLREEIYRVGYPKNFLIFDEDDMRSLVKDILIENNIDRKVSIVGRYMEELGCFKAVTNYIEDYMLPESSYSQSAISEIVVQILHRQRKYFALDFDDLQFFTLYILKTFPDCRSKWQQMLQYVMVDETQDCNGHDWELFSILSGFYGNLFVVGDSDQAIYEWRGAKPELFIDFNPDHEIYLKQNYRSTPNIVCLADSIVGNNTKRLPRTSVTMRSGGCRTIHLHCKDEKHEAQTLVNEIKSLGRKWSDVAVLYRASYLSRGIEQAFIEEKIPYVIWGGVRFFERKEIKDALSYLRLVVSDDDISFKRVVNVPSRKIGKKTLSQIEEYAKANNISMFQAMRNVPINKNAAHFISIIDNARQRVSSSSISDLLDSILNDSGIISMYRTDSDEERLENLQELIKSIKIYEEENEDCTIMDYLQDIALYTNADYRKDEDKVRIMTIHQAKGLEFPVVFIYGLNEGVFPSHRTIRERGLDGLEEERRLAYVACTRAMDKLYFTESEGYNVQTSQKKYPSRFIYEAKDDCGCLYDTIPEDFDTSLWDGTFALVKQIEYETGIQHVADSMDGRRVRHKIFGEGVITGIDQDIATVDFANFGIRRIRLNALEQLDVTF